jgi:hypothetical protein
VPEQYAENSASSGHLDIRADHRVPATDCGPHRPSEHRMDAGPAALHFARYLRDHRFSRIEAEEDVEDAWVRHNNEVADRTLYPLANSWYVGANIPGKPRIFMPYVGGVTAYKKKCDDVAVRGYEGFRLGVCVEEQRFAAD